MKKISGYRQVLILVMVFALSRIIVMFLGLHFSPWPLHAYWQYLDIETLRSHLLTGIWYDHTQPPVFNLFLGLVLKMGGSRADWLFTIILKTISLINAWLLLSIVRKLSALTWLPLAVSIAYILSPATLIFECELFYTTTVSFFLLLSVYFLIRLHRTSGLVTVSGVVFPLVLLCLTRSVYHVLWLFLTLSIVLIYYRKQAVFAKLLLASVIGILITGGWYVKNKIIFDKFTTSTWLGMNMARNVFHDTENRDSSQIEAYEPFSRIGVYRKFLDPEFETHFQGLNNRDLLQEMKNDSFINEKEVSYIPVSDLYQKASLQYVRSHPGMYIKNVLQSTILYFTPATVYSLAVGQSAKIKPYDLIYSFNLTHLASGKQSRRILLTISAFPKIAIYLFVFFIMIRNCIRSRSVSAWNLFIIFTILFIFGISSFFEHYENMRFRFETEPLFLLLAAQVFGDFYGRIREGKRKNKTIQKESASR